MEKRLKLHLKDRKQTYKSAWIDSLRDLGLIPKMEILEVIENSNDLDWQEVERFYIIYLRFLGFNLCNLDSGGRNGKTPGEETRRKMSARRKGKKLSLETRERMRSSHGLRFTNMAHSKEVRLKIGNAHRGKLVSSETRAKLAKASTGKVISKETKEKLSKLATGRILGKRGPITMAHKAAIRQSQSGKIVSQSTREKIRKAFLGKPRDLVTIANANTLISFNGTGNVTIGGEFEKANVNIVERLINKIMRSGQGKRKHQK